MGKKHQSVKFKDIAEKLPDLEGKKLEEIAGVLGQPLQSETKQATKF